MKEFLPEIDDLIAKVLTDEATLKEQDTLKTWLKDSSDNQQYFDELKHVWNDSSEAVSALDVNTDVAWAKVKKHIEAPKPLTIKWLSPLSILKAAAAILLIFTIFQVLNKKEQPQEKTYSAQTKVEQSTLTDGSVITLNKKSNLTTVFTNKERRVKLQGEAYFAVAHDRGKPFIIEVNTVEVKVVGTEFKIDNQSQPNKVIVVVEEGVVEVKGKNEIKRLTKGQKAAYDIMSSSFEPNVKNDINEMAFKSGELIFENRTTLSEAVNKINDYYNSSVEISSPNIANCPISRLVFNMNEISLDSILAIITEPSDIKIEKKNGKIYLKGNGCE